jgi:hypothetical protein
LVTQVMMPEGAYLRSVIDKLYLPCSLHAGNYAACGTAIDSCSALQSGYPTSQSFNSTSLGLFMSTAGQIATYNIEQSISSVQCCSTDNCNSNQVC